MKSSRPRGREHVGQTDRSAVWRVRVTVIVRPSHSSTTAVATTSPEPSP